MVARNGSSGRHLSAFRTFLGSRRDQLTGFTLTDDSGRSRPRRRHRDRARPGERCRWSTVGAVRSIGNARAAIDAIAQAINDNSHKRWAVRRPAIASRWARVYGTTIPASARPSPPPAASTFPPRRRTFVNVGVVNQTTPSNVPAYTVGMPAASAGSASLPGRSGAGDNGGIPTGPDYDDASAAIERDVDMFNLMVLPRAQGQDDEDRQALWGAASAFCARERAFLHRRSEGKLDRIAKAEKGADAIRIGVETRNAGCWWPQLRLADGTPTGKIADPGGSVAGVMARTDGARGDLEGGRRPRGDGARRRRSRRGG